MGSDNRAEIKARLTTYVDESWYFEKYPDVAQSGMAARKHYYDYGFEEGRQPRYFKALELEASLWSSDEPSVQLKALSELVHDTGIESSLTAWVLARWYGSFGQWRDVFRVIHPILNDPVAMAVVGGQGPWLLLFSAAVFLDKTNDAVELLEDSRWLDSIDKMLAKVMITNGEVSLEHLLDIWKCVGINSSYDINEVADPITLDKLSIKSHRLYRCSWYEKEPLVSIIIPMFNAQSTINTALRSILSQTWKNIEVIVVDDASTDKSVHYVNMWQECDPRVRLIKHSGNKGAYAARNSGLSQAHGKYITCHDADDWSHPCKIEAQVQLLVNNRKLVASLSHMARCDQSMRFLHWRIGSSWVQKNLSSLLFKRKVFRKLGFWDSVSIGADAEYHSRIKCYFGQSAIAEALPGIPLSFCKVEPLSLSQSSRTHLRTQFKGARRDYISEAYAWQNNTKKGKLFIPKNPESRPFPVPAFICRGSSAHKNANLLALIDKYQLFDTHWYQNKYADIKEARVDSLTHFLTHGDSEGRDPSQLFSTSAYKLKYGLSTTENALLHAIENEWDFEQPVCFKGVESVDKPHIALFAHLVSKTLYGAERSFLDVVKSLSSDFCLSVFIPSAMNHDYIDELQGVAAHIIVIPYRWWRNGRSEDLVLSSYLKQYMRQREIEVVYVNTLVLYEPFIVAKALKLPVITHVRELVESDPDLCRILDSTAAEIKQHITYWGDMFIANSNRVADWLGNKERTTVIPNGINLAVEQIKSLPNGQTLNIVMLSSNTFKKGLQDFFEIASRALGLGLSCQFHLYGSQSADLDELLSKCPCPNNVTICGYLPAPEPALSTADVIINLSHVEESFGRCVVEGMMAGRAIIAYRHGALLELVSQGETGYLVEAKDCSAVVEKIRLLDTDRELLARLGNNGREIAMKKYSLQLMEEKVSGLLLNLCERES